MKNWTVKQVERAAPGRHRVSESLYLFVGPNGVRRLIFRYTKPSTSRVTETGLGRLDTVTLAEARAKVLEYRRMVAQGLDPVERKREQRAESTTSPTSLLTTSLFKHADIAIPTQASMSTYCCSLMPPPWVRGLLPTSARRTSMRPSVPYGSRPHIRPNGLSPPCCV
jgi:hypothetical protein